VSSYSSTNIQLEYSNSLPISYTSVKILNAQVTASSSVVGALSIYSFAVNNTNTLLANSIMHIYFPSVFSLSGVSCTINAVLTVCTIINSTYLQFTLPALVVSQYNLYTYTLSVANVINPPSVRSTSSFAIFLESGLALVEGVSEGITVTMTTLTHFSTLSITPSSYVAGALPSYSINFATSLSIPAGSVLTLNFQLPN